MMDKETVESVKSLMETVEKEIVSPTNKLADAISKLASVIEESMKKDTMMKICIGTPGSGGEISFYVDAKDEALAISQISHAINIVRENTILEFKQQQEKYGFGKTRQPSQ